MIDNQRTNWPGWETVKLIGRGSFGAVYEIQRDVFGDTEKSALKVLSSPQNESDIEELYSDGYDDESITSTFQEHLRSIVEEYSLMRKLNGCANVVHCDDIRYVQHDDGFGWDIFIKMELLTPLMKVSASQSAEEMAIKVGKDICNALIACKEYGIVHRDIKPQNIFVSKYGDYKLGDFGIAKTVEKTMGGTKIGTYKYMAPEVYNNQPYGSAADIYSLGLVLYWLLNERRMPFLPLPPEKLSANMEEKARNRRFAGEQIPPPAHGSESLKKIVLKACAFDPKDRYATAAEMLRDLKEGFGALDVQRRKEEEERRIAEETERLRLQKETEERERVRKVREEQERLQGAAKEKADAERVQKQKTPIVQNCLDKEYNKEQVCLKRKKMGRLLKRVVLLGIVVMLYFFVADIFISQLITANITIGAMYPNTKIQECATSVNQLLKPLIGARDSIGLVYHRWGMRLNAGIAAGNIKSILYLIVPSLFMLIAPMVVGGYKLFKTYFCKKNPLISGGRTNSTKKVIGLAICTVVYVLTIEAYFTRMITGVIMLGFQFEKVRPVAIEITDFLVRAISGSRRSSGVIIDRYGRRLNPNISAINVINAMISVGSSVTMLVAPLAIGVKTIVNQVKNKAKN